MSDKLADLLAVPLPKLPLIGRFSLFAQVTTVTGLVSGPHTVRTFKHNCPFRRIVCWVTLKTRF
jgi:hypothetical protein